MRRTLFIHVPRTAGTSMNAHAMKHAVSYQDLSYSLRPKCDPSKAWTTTQHISIGSLIERNVFDEAWYRDCYRFAFVRNPWDRMVSLYERLRGYRLTQTRQRLSNLYLRNFEAFVEGLTRCDFVRPLGRLNGEDWSQANPQMEWLRWGVDFVGQYEKLHEDWKHVCETIEMPCHRLALEKPSNRKRDYRVYYNKRTRQLICNLYAEEIEQFGYDFED